MDPPPPPPISTSTQPIESLNSLNSSPRSKPPSDSHPPTNSPPKLRLMCSFGGHIVPRPHDKSLCYIGGDTRIVVVDRSSSLVDLISKISKNLISCGGINKVLLKYQLPSEDLDSLISITTDEDWENMVEEYDRLNSSFSGGKGSRIRLFLFPVKQVMSGSSIGSLFGSEVKSEDWFLNALNGGSSVGGLSGSNSVNSLLGLNDDGGVGKLGVIGKNVDGFTGVEFLDRTSSFGSDVHLSGLGNSGQVRVKEEKVGGEENVGGNGNGNGNGSEVGKVVVDGNVVSEKVVGDNVGKGLSDDEKSEHGGTGYRRQLQQQQQAQVVSSQLNQKSSGGGGGRDLASPDSVSSDGSITNPLSRQRPMMYQDPNVQYAPVQSRVASYPVEQKITDSRIQMQQQYQDSGYMLPSQYDPHHHPQLQQPQFIRTGSQYIQHLPLGAVPMPAYYPVHSHHPAVEQQIPVYYVSARQTQAYSMPVQHADYSEAAGAVPSNRPQAAPSAAMAPPSGQYSVASNATVPQSEVPASLYRTANTAPASVVQVPPGQPQPQYVGFSQIHHPQSSNPTPATATSYAYDFADPTQPHVYYAQPPAPQVAAQYQTMTSAAPQMAAQYQTMTSAAPQMAAQYQTMTSAAPETTAQLPADSIKQQVRTSQP